MNKQQALSDSRERIDDIDSKILDLLKERNQVVRDVIETKIKNKLPIFIPTRENEKIESFRSQATERGLDPDWAEDFLRMIMSASRASQSTSEFPSSTVEPKNFVIIGGKGEMGRLYTRIALSTGHNVRVLDKDDWGSVAELCENADVVIVSVPIFLTHETISKIAPFLPEKAILCDFTSTKNGLLEHMMNIHTGPVVSLHPMHGPDVHNLSKQLMLISHGRMENSYEWLIKQFELWGMRIKIVDALKHDHAMHMIQGLRHFVALLHGSFMRAYDLKPEDILDFSSPIYRAELMMTGRIFAQDARLYADIVFSDNERRKLLKHFFDHHFLLTRLVESGDKEGFVQEFNAISEFFGDFAEQALLESGYLIHRLADRFA
ncbi:bifunctional chorismate mutase/prephenate dehydrogenase [bacterium]|nr:MAG: bifunctional chorismate mutase/prephenate dehydrogenase [bacterium]